MAQRGPSSAASIDRLLAELTEIDTRRTLLVNTIRETLTPLLGLVAGELGERRTVGRRPGFKMSAAAKAKIAAAQRARWARFRAIESRLAAREKQGL
jgi:hypothetical protein